MKVLYTSSDFNCWRKTISPSNSVGFVPTMGALHGGHLSLVEASLKNADMTIVSIFVNPKQFSKDEDFDTYPRDLEDDLNKLKQYNVDIVFVPEFGDIYGYPGDAVVFDDPFSKTLEGASRPHFFPGVLDVVSRLFNIVNPNFAHFGRKDAQQLILIEKMVGDLGSPITIIPGETIRESGGLAMSSRNEYLTDEQKKSAEVVFKSLKSAKKLLDSGVVDSGVVRELINNIMATEKIIEVDYVSIVHLDGLLEVDHEIGGEVLISIAVVINSIRLIDNIFY
jgi:pantoate--beta-alanine ligase